MPPILVPQQGTSRHPVTQEPPLAVGARIDTKQQGRPGGGGGKESTDNAGDARDAGSIPELGRCPGEGKGSPLQGRGTWRASAHGVTKSWTRLSHCARTHRPLCLSLHWAQRSITGKRLSHSQPLVGAHLCGALPSKPGNRPDASAGDWPRVQAPFTGGPKRGR